MANYRKYPDRVIVDKDGTDIASTASNAVMVEVRTQTGDTAMDDTLDAVKVTGALLAGSTRIGTVSGVLTEVFDTQDVAATVAYSANDVMSADECATTGGEVWTFSACGRAASAYGYITKAVAITETESVTPRLTVFLFNEAPTGCNLVDNVANTAPDCADTAKYQGKIDFPAMECLGTSDSNAIATPSTLGNLPLSFKCSTANTNLYGVVVTRDAATITAADHLKIALTIEQY